MDEQEHQQLSTRIKCLMIEYLDMINELNAANTDDDRAAILDRMTANFALQTELKSLYFNKGNDND